MTNAEWHVIDKEIEAVQGLNLPVMIDSGMFKSCVFDIQEIHYDEKTKNLKFSYSIEFLSDKFTFDSINEYQNEIRTLLSEIFCDIIEKSI